MPQTIFKILTASQLATVRSGGLMQALFPALLDGQGPRPRPEVSEIDTARALAAWDA